ncbi:MAG: 50S ribosomal protein L16 [Candidatus Aenigmatarchaeota archaeon]
MGLRPGRCYRKLERPYTRISIKKPRKSYVKGVPPQKIHRFQAGVEKPEFTTKMFLVAKGAVQIRSNALEAMRVAASKSIEKHLGSDGYFLKVLIYPHHVLRENPLATGAGADRFQTGMRLSFGRPIGSAAQVRENQKILELRVLPEYENLAKKALKVAASKVPTACYIMKD